MLSRVSPAPRPSRSTDAPPRLTFDPVVREWVQPRSFEQALLALRQRQGLVALDSAGGQPAQYSWIAFDPIARTEGLASLEELRAWMGPEQAEAGDSPIPGPFRGGFVGALNYDLGVAGEGLDLPGEPWDWPMIVGGYYTDFLVFDHQAERVYLVVHRSDDWETRMRSLFAELNRPQHPKPFGVGRLHRHTSPPEHQRRIEEAREEIAAGDYYQVNLAHRFTAPMQGDPLDLYLRLRRSNAAPYAGYLRFPGGACLSSSPELLLDWDGQRAATRPIKGTIARSADPRQDAQAQRTLLASEKDRAELAMIVDLERNDLGRIAEPGSVHVPAFPELETYARVHHLVATVQAKPRAGVGGVDLLQALFPGGSITGAPKLASMEAIARLEEEGRGLFTGSLGFLDVRGHLRFNILIRTVLWRVQAPTSKHGERPWAWGIEENPELDRGELSFRVGGGITFASSAQDEDLETLHKAQGMTDAWSGDEGGPNQEANECSTSG